MKVLKTLVIFFLLTLSVNIAYSKTKIPKNYNELSDLDKCQLIIKLSHEKKLFYKIVDDNLVTVIYLSSPFYGLKFDEREMVAQCLYIVSKSKHPETKAITFSDDATGKFIGIYTAEKGLTLGR